MEERSASQNRESKPRPDIQADDEAGKPGGPDIQVNEEGGLGGPDIKPGQDE